MPVAPTPDQLAARTDPTPAKLQLPGGLFYDANDPTKGTLYNKNADGTYQSFNLSNLATELTGSAASGSYRTDQYSTYGKLADVGRAAFKDKYGVDISSAPSQGFQDEGALMSSGKITAGTADQLQKLLASGQAAPSSTQDINTPQPKGTAGTVPVPEGTPLPAGTTPAALPNNGSTAPTSNTLVSNLQGGKATTLYDYYTSQGKQLPSLTDRGAQFQSLGLGSAAEYTGSAVQNEALLNKLQLNDHSNSVIGSPAGGGASSINNTDAGASLAKTLAGGDATTTLDNYKTYLSSALGTAASKVSTDESALTSFFGTEKTNDQILQEEMDRQGISTQQSVLSELDKEIAAQQTVLAKLPDDIRSTLADVGVSQAQLDRLTAKETKGPTDALNALMKNRDATATEIDKAMTFAKQFADTRVAGQAAKLAALEWQITSDKGDYSKLDADAKAVVTSSISDQKSILTTALAAAKNGASSDVVDSILGSGSGAEAIQSAGSYLTKPTNTAATTALTKELGNLGGILEVGYTDPSSMLIHYNGRGPDGFVDPNLYTQQFNYIQQTYGNAGVDAFLKKFPPAKNVNPAAVGKGILPAAIENLVTAGQKKTTTSTIS